MMGGLENAVLYSRVDREDFWVNGIAFNVKNTSSYEETFKELKDRLQARNVLEYLESRFCLQEDIFENDDSFRFLRLHHDKTGLYYFFRNSSGEERSLRLQEDYVYIP